MREGNDRWLSSVFTHTNTDTQYKGFRFFLIFRLGSNPLQFLQFLHQYFKGKKKAKTNQPEDEAIKYKFSIEESFCNK